MKILLDTHIFLWYYNGSGNLSSSARKQIEACDQLFISSASLWEIAIKYTLGKLELTNSLERFFEDINDKGFSILPIDMMHILRTSTLPFHHRDPFDRLIIAHAITEELILATKDAQMSQYSKTDGLQIMIG
jgi:PIN domain nuclease of toxin-antitoxin system